MTWPRSRVARLSFAGDFVREVDFVLIGKGKRAQTLRAMSATGKPSCSGRLQRFHHYDSTLPNETSGCADGHHAASLEHCAAAAIKARDAVRLAFFFSGKNPPADLLRAPARA